MGTNAQQFCLKWNNHQANMLSVFDRLLSNKSLVDVTIGCEGRQVKAHKVVLSACSPFFENLFTENPCKHPIVILKDIRYADLTALVEFMYKGEVNVIQEQLPTLLKTAEALKIKGLAEVTGDSGKSDDKPHASVTPRPESPGSRRKRQRVRRKSTDSAAGGGGHSDSEESMPKASRTEHDDSSMDGATSLDDGSQASLQHQQTPSKQTSAQDALKDPSIVQSNNAVTVNNSPSSAPAHNNATNSTSNGPNSSSKDADFEPTRLLEASMTTDHGADNSTDLTNSTGPDNNSIVHDGLDIKPIITLEEGATPAGAIVPATTPSLPTGADAISSLFPQGTGATALPGTSYQASPQSHGRKLVEWLSMAGGESPNFDGYDVNDDDDDSDDNDEGACEDYEAADDDDNDHNNDDDIDDDCENDEVVDDEGDEHDDHDSDDDNSSDDDDDGDDEAHHDKSRLKVIPPPDEVRKRRMQAVMSNDGRTSKGDVINAHKLVLRGNGNNERLREMVKPSTSSSRTSFVGVLSASAAAAAAAASRKEKGKATTKTPQLVGGGRAFWPGTRKTPKSDCVPRHHRPVTSMTSKSVSRRRDDDGAEHSRNVADAQRASRGRLTRDETYDRLGQSNRSLACGERHNLNNLSHHNNNNNIIINNNNRSNEDVLRCPRCPETFSSRRQLRIHEPVHRLGQLYCGFCDQHFSSMQALKAHVMAKHTNERPYKCRGCNRKYSARSTLTNHAKKCSLSSVSFRR